MCIQKKFGALTVKDTHRDDLQLFVLTGSGLCLFLPYCCDKAIAIISVWKKPRPWLQLSASCHGECATIYRVCVCVFKRNQQMVRTTEFEKKGSWQKKYQTDHCRSLCTVCDHLITSVCRVTRNFRKGKVAIFYFYSFVCIVLHRSWAGKKKGRFMK